MEASGAAIATLAMVLDLTSDVIDRGLGFRTQIG